MKNIVPIAVLTLAFVIPTSVYATTVLKTAPGTYTWTVPNDVTFVLVETWAGGGGGGGARAGSDSGAGGGAGGGYAAATVLVTPGTVYTYYVGAGGAGGGVLIQSGAGEDSWFKYLSTIFVLSKGGGPGAPASGSNVNGGTAVNSTVGTVFRNGGNGAGGKNSYSGAGGGGAGSIGNGGAGVTTTAGLGGSPDGGNGGAGRTTGGGYWFWWYDQGYAGSAPGGGGAGAYTESRSRVGGKGGAGQVRLTYTAGAQPPPPPNITSVAGYAWSDTVGWIDLAPAGSGVTKNDDDGTLAGYAWSDNIGWIKFGGLSGFPSGGNAQVSGNNVTGWARACAGTLSGDCNSMTSRADGWDGWISLGGANYGATYSNGGFSGHAWGSDVVGWIDFSAGTPPSPPAPASLIATAGACGTNEIILDWTAPASGYPYFLTNYNLHRTGGGSPATITIDPDIYELIDTSVADGTLYSYNITARYSDGRESDKTETSPPSLSSPFLCPPPDSGSLRTSSNCVPTPGNRGSATLTWDAPVVVNNNNLRNYYSAVYQNGSPVSPSPNVTPNNPISPTANPHMYTASNLLLGTYNLGVYAQYQSNDNSSTVFAPVTVEQCSAATATCAFENIGSPYPVVGVPVTLKVTPSYGNYNPTPPFVINWSGTELSNTTTNAGSVSDAILKKVYTTVGIKAVHATITDDNGSGISATCDLLADQSAPPENQGPNVRVRPVYNEY